MESIFNGSKSLFDGLWIGNSGYQFEKYPVIHLDFSCIKFEDKSSFNDNLVKLLIDAGKINEIYLESDEYDRRIIDLINNLSLYNNGKRVVILIDEYDSPLFSENMAPKLEEEIIKILHTFYKIIKALDSKIHFLFVTGVTQLVRTAMGQSTSNLTDISL
jgi:hypothetical protein